jgi:hypothetical protein
MFVLFGAKYRIVKIYLEDVYDIFFFIINSLCISLLHTQYTFLYIFLLYYLNFIKMCVRRCAQIMTYFFLLVDINLNHNVIFYFFITLLILYNYIDSKCIFSLVLRYLKKRMLII